MLNKWRFHKIEANKKKIINKEAKRKKSFPSFLVGTAIFLQLTEIFQHLKNIKIARIHVRRREESTSLK